MINYKPPYWYHDNIKFSEEELNSLKRELDTLGSEKYTENKQCITTFFLEDELRPEMKYKDKYFNIAEQITKNAGIYHKVIYNCRLWMQLYDNNMSHTPHQHAKLDPYFDDIISWVHFIDVPEQKCFRFTDTKGNTFVPDEQSTGDLICFPSWSWHEVLPNKTDHRRLIISGNISVFHYD